MTSLNHNSISEIRALLDSRGIALKKRFGQNFLVDGNIRTRLGDRIVGELPNPLPPDREVWEIGPGLGALTDELLARNVPLRLFEIDRGVIAILRERYGDDPPIEEGDFLDTFGAAPPPGAIVGNLPYHSAGAIIPRIVETGVPAPVMVFLLQREMVDRITAAVGNKNYSAFSVLVQNHYTVSIAFHVPAVAFYPRPRVDSAVAIFRERPERPDPRLSAQLSRVTRTAFAQRRKTLRNTLKAYLPQLQACGIDPSLRPEHLPPERFLAIALQICLEMS